MVARWTSRRTFPRDLKGNIRYSVEWCVPLRLLVRGMLFGRMHAMADGLVDSHIFVSAVILSFASEGGAHGKVGFLDRNDVICVIDDSRYLV